MIFYHIVIRFSCHSAYGQLGLGDTIDRNLPSAVLGLQTFEISQVALGGAHSLVATRDDLIFAFGFNQNGQVNGFGR